MRSEGKDLTAKSAVVGSERSKATPRPAGDEAQIKVGTVERYPKQTSKIRSSRS